MSKAFVLITGRSTKQGRTLHLGKDAKEYIEEISKAEMNPADMQTLQLKDGDQVRLSTKHGSSVVRCKKGTVPPGLLFVAYGHFVNTLVGPDTQGTGMPDSKGFQVEVTRDDRG